VPVGACSLLLFIAGARASEKSLYWSCCCRRLNVGAGWRGELNQCYSWLRNWSCSCRWLEKKVLFFFSTGRKIFSHCCWRQHCCYWEGKIVADFGRDDENSTIVVGSDQALLLLLRGVVIFEFGLWRRETVMKLKPNQGRDSGFFFIYEMRTNGEDRGNDLLPPRAVDLGFFSFVFL